MIDGGGGQSSGAGRRSAAPLLLLLAGLACAAGFGSVAPPAPQDADDLALDQVYNLEYDAARQTLDAQLRLHPDDLRALNYLGNLTLDEELLREGLYSAEAYTNRGVAARQNRPEMPAGYEAKFMDILQRAQNADEARLKQNPSDPDALYWAGVTHATRAEFYFTLKRSYMTALHEGQAAYKFHQRLYRLNPGYTDALLVMGMGQYTAGSLPWYFKVLASIAGFRGSRARGFEDLKQVSERGHYARDDAKIILVVLYRREGMYAQALDELRDLARLYPRNFLALTEMVRIEEAAGDWRSAARTADELMARLDSRAPGYELIPAARILYETGKAHEHLGEMDQALRLYDRAAAVPGKKPFSYQAELAAAQLDLRLNHPAAARQRYQRVAQAVPDTEEGKAARQALQGLRK